jgi:hypothetical protein
MDVIWTDIKPENGTERRVAMLLVAFILLQNTKEANEFAAFLLDELKYKVRDDRLDRLDALYAAIHAKNWIGVGMLIQRGLVDINGAFHVPCRLARSALFDRPMVHLECWPGFPVLWPYLFDGQVEAVHQLRLHGVDLAAKDRDGNTAFHLIAKGWAYNVALVDGVYPDGVYPDGDVEAERNRRAVLSAIAVSKANHKYVNTWKYLDSCGIYPNPDGPASYFLGPPNNLGRTPNTVAFDLLVNKWGFCVNIALNMVHNFIDLRVGNVRA